MKSSVKNFGRILIAVFSICLVLGLPGIAAAAHTELGGIWWHCTGPANTSFSIINMTTADFKITSVPSDEHMFSVNQVIKSYESATWSKHVTAGTVHSSGSLVLQPVSGSQGVDANYMTRVLFSEADGYSFIYGKGTWIRLDNPNGINGNAAKSTGWVNGRWATAYADNEMHNIMTMVSPKMTATLYSQDNANFVLVIAQTPGNWAGWQLDWVQNGGDSLPRAYQ